MYCLANPSEKVTNVLANNERLISSVKNERGSISRGRVTWSFTWTAIKMIKEDKKYINHEGLIANFLNEYKLYDQTLEVVKEATKLIFLAQGKPKVKIASLKFMQVTVSSAPLLKPPLETCHSFS